MKLLLLIPFVTFGVVAILAGRWGDYVVYGCTAPLCLAYGVVLHLRYGRHVQFLDYPERMEVAPVQRP